MTSERKPKDIKKRDIKVTVVAEMQPNTMLWPGQIFDRLTLDEKRALKNCDVRVFALRQAPLSDTVLISTDLRDRLKKHGPLFRDNRCN